MPFNKRYIVSFLVNSRVVNLCSKVQLKAHTVIYPNAFDCFPGCSTAKTLQMLKLMNLATISERSFHRHTSSYLNAIVIQQWKKHQQGLTSGFLEKNDGLILAGCNDIVINTFYFCYLLRHCHYRNRNEAMLSVFLSCSFVRFVY